MGARAHLKPVMDGGDVIESYQRLLKFSNNMLAHARKDDWAALIESEMVYVAEVEKLQNYEIDAMLDEGQQEQKLELLEQLLEQDKEIRERLLARRQELEKLISSASQKKKVEDAYLSS
ncbi:MAG: flagellar protein FliT [Gammaproteobacteria bacterium]|nr:flagellar protein FliT [Gammaproteobacteria bacterium]